MRESLTEHTFVFPDFGNKEVTIKVPFSKAEIEILGRAYDLVKSLSKEMAKGSGWQREVYVCSVPWGGGLSNRTSAFVQIEKLYSLLQEIRDPRFKDYSETDITKRPRDFAQAMFEILDQVSRS